MNSNDIKNEIAQLTLELNKHQKNVDLLKQLSEAEANVRRIRARLDRLTTELNDAFAAEAKVAEETIKNGFRDMAIAVHAGQGGGLLRAQFPVTYEVRTCDRDGESWRPVTVGNVSSLSDDALRYLLAHSASSIPAEIMALAPGDPSEALRKYQVALHRGYIAGDLHALHGGAG